MSKRTIKDYDQINGWWEDDDSKIRERMLRRMWDTQEQIRTYILEYSQLPEPEARRRFIQSGGDCNPQSQAYYNPKRIDATAPQLKRINMDRGYFTAGGKRWFLQPEIAMQRYPEYLRLTIETTFGLEFHNLWGALALIEQHLAGQHQETSNSLLAAHKEALEQLALIKNRIQDFDKMRWTKIMEFCTLFINAEDEDITKWDIRLAQSKIDIWKEEGFSMNDFFLLYRQSVLGLPEAFRSLRTQADAEYKQVPIPQNGPEQPTDGTSSETLKDRSSLTSKGSRRGRRPRS